MATILLHREDMRHPIVPTTEEPTVTADRMATALVRTVTLRALAATARDLTERVVVRVRVMGISGEVKTEIGIINNRYRN